MTHSQRRYGLFVLALVAVFALAGCRGAAAPTSPADANINMQASVAPWPPAVGDATMVISIRDSDNNPVEGATVALRGDMDHAGMQPVLRETSEGTEGLYTLPYEWTMGGDWFVVVTATLPDGDVIEQQFDFTVDGEMDMDGDMDMDSDMDMDNEESSDE